MTDEPDERDFSTELTDAYASVLAGRSALVLEDDPEFGKHLCASLHDAGFTDVEWTLRGDEALEAARARRYDVLLLDRMTPGMDGLSVLKAVRAFSQDAAGTPADVPILMVTLLHQDRQKLEGLLGGADDYVPKPVTQEELIARVGNFLLRRQMTEPGAQAPAHPVYRNGPLELNTGSHQLLFRGTPVELRPKEFLLMRELMRTVGQPVTRTMLWDRCWPDWNFQPESWVNTVDQHVRRLRRSLEAFEAKLPQAYRPTVLTYRNQGLLIRDLSALDA